jgi:hypothetical protein
MPKEKSAFDLAIEAAVNEGRKVTQKKKKKAAPAYKVYGGHVGLGTFYRHSVIAQYLKRICGNCGYTEISAVPRLFLSERATGDKTARKLTTIRVVGELNYLLRSLPLRIELHPAEAPCCKHCLKELVSDAKRTTTEGHSNDQGQDSKRAYASTIPTASRALQTRPVPDV